MDEALTGVMTCVFGYLHCGVLEWFPSCLPFSYASVMIIKRKIQIVIGIDAYWIFNLQV